jgi:hypothetical protein
MTEKNVLHIWLLLVLMMQCRPSLAISIDNESTNVQKSSILPLHNSHHKPTIVRRRTRKTNSDTDVNRRNEYSERRLDSALKIEDEGDAYYEDELDSAAAAATGVTQGVSENTEATTAETSTSTSIIESDQDGEDGYYIEENTYFYYAEGDVDESPEEAELVTPHTNESQLYTTPDQEEEYYISEIDYYYYENNETDTNEENSLPSSDDSIDQQVQSRHYEGDLGG